MAITNNDLKFLIFCKKHGADFSQTLTLGRLNFYGSLDYLNNIALNIINRNANDFKPTDGYSDSIFRFLGAETIDSIDNSPYEKATIIHDLNKPVDSSMHEKYSVVLDSGTIEHVFNFPVAISNCMNMLKTGGHYIGITPANNLMGHGFYQFSPELFFRVFNNVNGFEINSMLITASDENGNATEWYEVIDPELIKERVILTNSFPAFLMILARKVKHVPVFSTFPQQSDYQYTWDKSNSGSAKKITSATSLLKSLIPTKIRDILYVIRKQASIKTVSTDRLGELNNRHFRKTDL